MVLHSEPLIPSNSSSSSEQLKYDEEEEEEKALETWVVKVTVTGQDLGEQLVHAPPCASFPVEGWAFC